MNTTGSATHLHQAELPPLTIPQDIWDQMAASEQSVLRRAQNVFDHLVLRETMPIVELREATGLAVEDLLPSLHALSGMRLVEVESDGQELVVKLIAVPDEHVKVMGPDNKARWIFVARPLVAPEIDPSQLN
jgi:hypothetical protein